MQVIAIIIRQKELFGFYLLLLMLITILAVKLFMAGMQGNYLDTKIV